jgi:hypothetical protein
MASATAPASAAPTTSIVDDAPPPAVPLWLAIDFDTLWRRDSGYALFSSSHTDSAVGLSLGYDLARLGSRGTLAVVAGWQSESTETNRYVAGPQSAAGATFAAVQDASFHADIFSLGAVARWRLLSWLEPHARVALGAASGSMSLTLSDGTSFSGHAWSPQVSAGAGFRLRSSAMRLQGLPSKPAFAVAATAEGGLIVGAPMAFSLHAPTPADADEAKDRIPTGAIDVGNLGRTQPYLRLSIALLF